MTDENSTPPQAARTPPRWQPIGAIDRRVAGVLAEKAKTTPSGYPMSLSAIRTACNQKSNRAPAMDLEPEDVEESLDRLRELGAVGMIEGYGRVAKYRHYLYEWLAVDKVELAVMAELLLRGAQTEGELRGRAARMEPIRDLAELRPVLGSLKSKGLVIPLTPEGRGHVLTHALYQPRELENAKAQYGQVAPTVSPAPTGTVDRAPPAGEPLPQAPTPQPEAPAVEVTLVAALRRDIDELRSQLTQLRGELEELSARQQQTDEELRKLNDALGT
ncbi:MAG: DUF480 domain-containing protein [Planctomycetota bacterium]|jgi:uncharacterized protein YceH (UPF0502 family)